MVVSTGVVFEGEKPGRALRVGGGGFNRLTGTVSPTSAQDWGWRFESADRDGQPYRAIEITVGPMVPIGR